METGRLKLIKIKLESINWELILAGSTEKEMQSHEYFSQSTKYMYVRNRTLSASSKTKPGLSIGTDWLLMRRRQETYKGNSVERNNMLHQNACHKKNVLELHAGQKQDGKKTLQVKAEIWV